MLCWINALPIVAVSINPMNFQINGMSAKRNDQLHWSKFYIIHQTYSKRQTCGHVARILVETVTLKSSKIRDYYTEEIIDIGTGSKADANLDWV